jgi:hypothetical protein
MPNAVCKVHFGQKPRFVEISVDSGERHREGDWSLLSNSPDPELSIGFKSGTWFMFEEGDGTWTLYMMGKDQIVLELWDLDPDFLVNLQCFGKYQGIARRYGPPESFPDYTIRLFCL